MNETKFRKVHLFQCPCGYRYEPEKGDPDSGYACGTHFDDLPDHMTCPRCHRPKVHFKEKKFSVPEN
jgi:rubredoxin